MTINGFIAYVKQLWKNKPDTSTPLSADRLTHLENGIKGNSDAIEKLAAAVINQITNDPNKIASMAALYSVKQTLDTTNNNLAGKIYSHGNDLLVTRADDESGLKYRLIASNNGLKLNRYVEDSGTTLWTAATNADILTKQDSLKLPRDTPVDYPAASGGSGAAKAGGWVDADGNTSYYNLMMDWALVQFKMQHGGLWIRMCWGNNTPSGWKQLIP